MKKFNKILISCLAIFTLCTLLFCITACNGSNGDTASTVASTAADGKTASQKYWEANARYREDSTFGEGAKTVRVVVKYQDCSVTFTIKTDREMLGDALVDHALIEGEQGAYGMYVKKVNGILADYDVDQSWWALRQNGEDLMSGVDTTPVADGATYELVYAK